MKYKLFLTYFLLLTFAGSLLIYFATTLGIGLSPDSGVYIGAARNLWLGNGLQAPNFEGHLASVTHYPPLLSTLIAYLGYLGLTPIVAFRYLHIFIYINNISLITYGLFRYTQQNKKLTAWGITFITFSVPLLVVYSMAWSEALFLYWLLWSLFFTTKYLEYSKTTVASSPTHFLTSQQANKVSPIQKSVISHYKLRSTIYLIAASITTAAAFLTRYIGITVVGTLIVAILLLNRNHWWYRFKAAFLAGLISVLPMLLWLLNNVQTSGNATNRSLSFHLPTLNHLKQLMGSLTTWVCPVLPDLASPKMRLLLALPLFIVAGIYGFILIWVTHKQAVKHIFSFPRRIVLARYPFFATLSIFLATYGLFLLTAITLFDASTPLNLRILMPVYLIGVVCLLLFAHHYYYSVVLTFSTKSIFFIQKATQIIAGIFLLVYIGTALYWTQQAHQQGLGFHHQSWKNSSIMAYLEPLPAQTPIYTNGIRATYLLTNRIPTRFPMLKEPTSGQKNLYFEPALRNMQQALTTKKGIIVYFNKYPHLTYLPSEQLLLEQLPLQLIHQAVDGNIYKINTD